MGSETGNRPIEVAVIGGGCAAIAAAFELTRPRHNGKYHVTVYQLGWRLGGKGASGRGPAARIEEHGLHVWLGFYENAFRLLRECYAELGRDREKCPIADWQDAFFPDPFVGMAEPGGDGGWLKWTALFPPAPGLPGDALTTDNPFTVRAYLSRTAGLLRTLLIGVQTHQDKDAGTHAEPPAAWSVDQVVATINRLLKYGVLASSAGIVEALAILDVIARSVFKYPENAVVRFLTGIRETTRKPLEEMIQNDPEVRYIWEIIDLVIAIMVGIIRCGLITNPKGFDAINDQDCREWLIEHGASERSVDSAFVRGLFDLAMAYPGGDAQRPRLAAGQAIRGSLRMFFSYRGSLFWKMRAGMGDVVFAPFYEVLKRRGVNFEFFHRLENVRLGDAGDHVAALQFDVQANTRNGRPYAPLIDVRGLPCWPSSADYSQLDNGDTMAAEGWQFECFWDRNKVATKTLNVGRDFDFVVLGVGVGAIPHVCGEILERDRRWRDMVEHVTSVPSQAFQIWMREDMAQLGWTAAPPTLSAFVKPFDTWADMGHLIDQECWASPPKSIAYFCSVLSDPETPAPRSEGDYPRQRHLEVRANAIGFLNRNVGHLWPRAPAADGGFRWGLLVDPENPDAIHGDETAFDSQFWTANVNPSDRYTLALPGSMEYRISPLDNTYDNLTIAGDWTDCGFNEGCVEAAVMSGRLAAHALCKSPALEEIIGYDHP